MTLNQAFSIRVREILRENNMTQRRLEQLTGIYHSTMNAILNDRVNASNFKSIATIVRELGYSLKDFFNSPIFKFDNLDLD